MKTLRMFLVLDRSELKIRITLRGTELNRDKLPTTKKVLMEFDTGTKLSKNRHTNWIYFRHDFCSDFH